MEYYCNISFSITLIKRIICQTYPVLNYEIERIQSENFSLSVHSRRDFNEDFELPIWLLLSQAGYLFSLRISREQI